MTKPITISDVEQVLGEACRLGKTAAHAGATEVEQEEHLVALMQEAATNLGFDPAQILHIGGHAFPDVVIDGIGVGVEIKCTANHRNFNGNSVWGSMAKSGLSRIYLLYWIRDDMEFGYKNYFECVTDVVATHYPRFRLYLDATDKDRVFGSGAEKVGTEKEIIFGADGIQSEKILQWMRDKAIASGSTPWWIPLNNSAPTGSVGLRSLSETGAKDIRLKNEILKKSYLMFPEIICETGTDKYRNLFAWAIGRYGVMLSRDAFSAGGQKQIKLESLGGVKVKVPAVVCKAKEALECDGTLSLAEIHDELLAMAPKLGASKSGSDWKTFLAAYRQRLARSSFLNEAYAKWCPVAGQAKATRHEFIEAVVDCMLKNFERSILN
jgi:hypothetical protein